MILLPGSRARAQETINTLSTGSGGSLISAERQVSAPGMGTSLFFRFGFATDETLLPGEIFDSFTISIRNTLSSDTAVLVTADASGFNWAPATPGTFPLESSLIVRTPGAFPSVEPVLTTRLAYDVSFQLPEAFRSAPLDIYFDLFNNGNPAASLAFFSEPLVVPEPSMLWLLAGALITGAAFRSRRRNH